MKQIFLLSFVFFSFYSCGGNVAKNVQATDEIKQTDQVEVLYFHGKKRCITCDAIEKLTKEVVDSLANDKIVMKIIDISKAENKATATKYEVTWSSLILDRNGETENLTKLGFGYAKNKPDEFKAKLVESIQKMAQ